MSAPASVRQLGLVSATALVIANMVGTGIFTTSGLLLQDLPAVWAVLLVWGVWAVQAALGALCYGALARAMPESGGEYLFVSRTVHPSAGTVVGWVTLPAGFAAPLAASAYAFGAYVAPWVPGWPRALAGTLLVVVFSVLHGSQVRRGAWVQNAGVALNLVLIAGCIAVAAGRTQLPPLVPAEMFGAAPLPAYAVALVWVSYSFFGWNCAAYIGGEVADPERNLPRAMLLGAGVVAVLYLGLNAVFLGAAPLVELQGRVDLGRVAAEAVGGPAFGTVVSALVALVLVTSVSSFVMAGPRVYARMAVDGAMPRWMAGGAGRPPRLAIAVQSALALVLLWTATFGSLLTYIGFTLSVANAATILGLIRLRRREGPVLRMPGWPWVPALFLAIWSVMALLTLRHRPVESAVGLATLAGGWLAWRFGHRDRRPAGP